jgi:Tfp pilus assembly protein PilX
MSIAGTASGQRGIMLIAVLFLIVVLAGLGLFAVRLDGGQQQSVNLTLRSIRAQAAANTGIEFAANRALRASGCVAPITTFNLTLTQAALNGFNVLVTCGHTTHVVGATTYNVYTLNAFAQSGTYGAPGYVARSASRIVSVP